MQFKPEHRNTPRKPGEKAPQFRDPKSLKLDGLELIPLENETTEVPPEGEGFGSWEDLKKST